VSSQISEYSGRFLQLIEALGFADIQKFGRAARIAHTTVRHQVETGRFSMEVLSELSKRGGNVDWLVSGDGPMLRGGAAPPQTEDPFVLRQAQRITALLEERERMMEVSAEERRVLQFWRKNAAIQQETVLKILKAGAGEKEPEPLPVLNEPAAQRREER
jgi:hypothetical protein